MTDFVRPMFAQPSRHRKRCDMSRCTNFAAIDFSRCGGNIGKLDLCQDCIDEIAKYASKPNTTPSAETETVKVPEAECPPETAPETPETSETVPETLKCQYCGRICGGELGLKSHERHCKDRP